MKLAARNFTDMLIELNADASKGEIPASFVFSEMQFQVLWVWQDRQEVLDVEPGSTERFRVIKKKCLFDCLFPIEIGEKQYVVHVDFKYSDNLAFVSS